MNIIEAIREYISDLDCMATFEINVNYLDGENDSFSIEEVPCNPIIKKYLDGSTLRQYQFVFCDYALSIYSQVLVSILIISPSLMKRGTLISAPVSTVAGLRVFVAVLPLIPGSVAVT